LSVKLAVFTAAAESKVSVILGGSKTNVVAVIVVMSMSPASGTFSPLPLAPLPEFALAALAPVPSEPAAAALPPLLIPEGPLETAALLPHAAATAPRQQKPNIPALRVIRVSSHAIVL
jgi:hypothetical protein